MWVRTSKWGKARPFSLSSVLVGLMGLLIVTVAQAQENMIKQDTDKDGRVDRIAHLDKGGAIKRLDIDSNGDGIKVKLPQARASAPQTEQEITVYVDREEKAFPEHKEISLGNLFRRLKEMIGVQKDRLVVIRADRRTILITP